MRADTDIRCARALSVIIKSKNGREPKHVQGRSKLKYACSIYRRESTTTDEGVTLKLDMGVAFVCEHEILLRGAVWDATVDICVTEYAKAIGELTEGLEDLALSLGNDPMRRQELRYLSMVAGELQGKLDNILQMLPRGPRTKRGILSIGGKTLKFIFGAALSEDLGPINNKIETWERR
jgi:hypothetical protein